jgi:hypothetical protein
MPLASFSPLTPRWCASCQQPLQGRSDKKFCSSACRGMAKRYGLREDDAPDWPALVAAAEQNARALQTQLDEQAQAWQDAFPFERRFDDLFRLMNGLIAEVSSLEQLRILLGFLDQSLQTYQQHPGLATGEVVAQRRIGLLQELCRSVVAHQATLQKRLDQEREWEEQRRLRQVAAEAARAAEQAARLVEEEAQRQAVPTKLARR